MEDYYVIDHIIRLCHERNWTYYRLAKESNIPYSSLCAMLNHRHIPTINNLIKICNGFNISLSEFFWGIEMNTCINQKPSLAYLWNKLDVKSKELMLNHISSSSRITVRIASTPSKLILARPLSV